MWHQNTVASCPSENHSFYSILDVLHFFHSGRNLIRIIIADMFIKKKIHQAQALVSCNQPFSFKNQFLLFFLYSNELFSIYYFSFTLMLRKVLYPVFSLYFLLVHLLFHFFIYFLHSFSIYFGMN